MSLMTVYVAPARYTFKYMEKAKYFTVMEFDDAHKDILDYMGHHSGRDGDKAKAWAYIPIHRAWNTLF